MSIHIYHSHRINISSLQQICQSFFCDPRMIRPSPGSSESPARNLSGTRRMIRPYTGSSGPGRPPIYRPVPAPASLSLFFLSSPAPPPFLSSLHARRFGDLVVGFRWGWILWTPLASETPFPSIFSLELLDLHEKLNGNSFKTHVA